MFALIHRTPASEAVPALPIAGLPLIVRQLQWLRALGVERVAVELPNGPQGEPLATLIHRWDPAGREVAIVRTDRRRRAVDVAQLGGFDARRPILAIPNDLLCDADLTACFRAWTPRGLRISFCPPGFFAGIRPRAWARLLGPDRSAREPIVFGPGWGVRVRDLGAALQIGDAVLSGYFPSVGTGFIQPIQIHGAEVSRGVWVARGARVHPSAQLIAPVWVGERAVVERDAVVGPGAHLGARSVIARFATVERSIVGEGTMVGEGVRLERVAASPRAVLSLDTWLEEEVDDPYVLDRRPGLGLLS